MARGDYTRTAAGVLGLVLDASSDALDVVLAAGTALVGKVGIDQTTPGTTDRVTVGGTAKVAVEKTRPNDTNAYGANDAINESAGGGTNWTFAVGRTATGGGMIVGANVLTDDTTWTARLELDLYDTNPTAINDNAEATRLYASVGPIGSITFPATSRHTTNATANDAAVANVNLPFKCLAASSIYGILRTLDAVASPVAQKKYTVVLLVAQD